jgi:hypothetical protein
MKRSSRWTIAVLGAVVWMLLLAPAGWCGGSGKAGTTSDIKKSLHDTGQAIRNFTISKKKDLSAKIHSTLNALDKRIKKIEADAKKNGEKMDKAAREKSERSLNALKKKREEAGSWSSRLKNSSSRAWKRVKKKVVDSWRALEKAFADTEKDTATK